MNSVDDTIIYVMIKPIYFIIFKTLFYLKTMLNKGEKRVVV